MSSEDPPLVKHLEQHLGRYEQGSKIAEHTWIVEFRDQPTRGALTACSLGLSSHRLEQPSGTPLRQELLLSARGIEFRELGSILGVAVKTALGRHAAVLRGELLGPTGELLPGCPIRGFLCIHPAYFPEALERFELDGNPVTFGWLVPVHPSEARYIESHGRTGFESLISEHDPDLLDWNRPALPGC